MKFPFDLCTKANKQIINPINVLKEPACIDSVPMPWPSPWPIKKNLIKAAIICKITKYFIYSLKKLDLLFNSWLIFKIKIKIIIGEKTWKILIRVDKSG